MLCATQRLIHPRCRVRERENARKGEIRRTSNQHGEQNPCFPRPEQSPPPPFPSYLPQNKHTIRTHIEIIKDYIYTRSKVTSLWLLFIFNNTFKDRQRVFICVAVIQRVNYKRDVLRTYDIIVAKIALNVGISSKRLTRISLSDYHYCTLCWLNTRGWKTQDYYTTSYWRNWPR